MTNKIGFTCFSDNLKILQDIFKKAAEAENAALALYQSDARKVLFNLEGLARIYKKIYSKRLFKAFQNSFKSLEDQLGKIDFYDSFWIEFNEIKDFPPLLLNQLKQSYFDEIKNLDALLQKEDWLNVDGKIKSIFEKLEAVKWLDDKEERTKIAQVIAKKILKTEDQYKSGTFNFDDMETGVHEFRRKIRWFSIYATSLDGLVQLKKDNYDQFLAKYLTPEVLKSKFNIMPKRKGNIEAIEISQSPFYALSWMINESGNLKDYGFKLVLLEELKNKADKKDIKPLEDIMSNIGNENPLGLNEIKDQLKLEADHFIYTDRVLDMLIKDFNEAAD